MGKVLLAFSGGLDTSYCVKYLSTVKELEVHSVTINTGGFNKKELDEINRKALMLGVKTHTNIDRSYSFYNKCIKFLIFGNVLKNHIYPLSVSAERVFQAIAIANFAKKIKADYVAHGSTGAGNDQVRFDMIFNILIPNIEILTPIRDSNISREEEIKFLKRLRIDIKFSQAKYSINKGLWGTSIGGIETLTSNKALPEHEYSHKLKENDSEIITIGFYKGELISINDKVYKNKIEAINKLYDIANPYAIGRDIHIGDTIIGIKGRVAFEASAPLIIIKAHQTLEKHTLTKWQLYWKDQLSMWYGNWLHEGQFLDPVMRNIESFFEESQKNVNGKVFISLHPHGFKVIGIESKNDLMSKKFGSYGERNKSWTGDDVKGFSKIFGNQLKIYTQINGLST